MRRRNIIRRILPLCICVSLIGGCSANTTTESTESSQAAANTAQGMTAEEAASTFSLEDSGIDWKNQEHTTIRLEEGAADISTSGIYEITGGLKDGSVTVNVDKTRDAGTVYLVLNNASIESSTSAPIYIKEAKKVVIFLEDGTVNTVTQKENVVTDESGNPSSAVFSKADLTIAGTGTLQVVSAYNDGITSKDDLIISGGVIQVSAVGDGITGKDRIAVKTADITIDAGKDGMRSTNTTDTTKGSITISGGTFNIKAANDAIQAEQVLQIDGGIFDLNSGGGYPGKSIKTSSSFGGGKAGGEPGVTETSSTVIASTETATTEAEESKKALKAGAQVIVNGGTFTISSYEDAIHSNGAATISGGVISIETGDDAIHADGAVTIAAGEITIKNSNEGIEGSDITITDGVIALTSGDDGINVSSETGTLTIDGGTITIAGGGDGIDSNGNIVMNGGTVIVHTDTVGAGNTPIDYDGTCTVNGGTLTDQNGATIDYANQQRGGGHRQAPADAPSGAPADMPSGAPADMPNGAPPNGERPQRGRTTDESGS